jgi:hypothetical protein
MPSRAAVYSCRKFVPDDRYPVAWGLIPRHQPKPRMRSTPTIPINPPSIPTIPINPPSIHPTLNVQPNVQLPNWTPPVNLGTRDDPPFRQEGDVRDDTNTSVLSEPINDGTVVQEATPARPPMPTPMTSEAPVMKTASEPQRPIQQPVALESIQPEPTKNSSPKPRRNTEPMQQTQRQLPDRKAKDPNRRQEYLSKVVQCVYAGLRRTSTA